MEVTFVTAVCAFVVGYALSDTLALARHRKRLRESLKENRNLPLTKAVQVDIMSDFLQEYDKYIDDFDEQ